MTAPADAATLLQMEARGLSSRRNGKNVARRTHARRAQTGQPVSVMSARPMTRAKLSDVSKAEPNPFFRANVPSRSTDTHGSRMPTIPATPAITAVALVKGCAVRLALANPSRDKSGGATGPRCALVEGSGSTQSLHPGGTGGRFAGGVHPGGGAHPGGGGGQLGGGLKRICECIRPEYVERAASVPDRSRGACHRNSPGQPRRWSHPDRLRCPDPTFGASRQASHLHKPEPSLQV